MASALSVVLFILLQTPQAFELERSVVQVSNYGNNADCSDGQAIVDLMGCLYLSLHSIFYNN